MHEPHCLSTQRNRPFRRASARLAAAQAGAAVSIFRESEVILDESLAFPTIREFM